MSSQRHLELVPIIHHSILRRFDWVDRTKDLNREKLLELAETNKYILETNPEAEHIYMEKVIILMDKLENKCLVLKVLLPQIRIHT